LYSFLPERARKIEKTARVVPRNDKGMETATHNLADSDDGRKGKRIATSLRSSQ
jgi:hypothetical protein